MLCVPDSSPHPLLQSSPSPCCAVTPSSCMCLLFAWARVRVCACARVRVNVWRVVEVCQVGQRQSLAALLRSRSAHCFKSDMHTVTPSRHSECMCGCVQTCWTLQKSSQ
jgi:hypothetical protein